MASALREHRGLWFGWSGKTAARFTGKVRQGRADGIRLATVDLDAQDSHEYYNGYANRAVWPVFHDLEPYAPLRPQGYERIAARFARALVPLVGSDDVVWAHDYHLLTLGQELRKVGLRNAIGFFLHTPWPSYAQLQKLAGHREIVEALFHYDLLGFQTEGDVRHFAETVSAFGGRARNDMAFAFGKTVSLGAFPVGIDAEGFAAVAASPQVEASVADTRKMLGGRKLILGVDRLDLPKGLEERFLCYEEWLARHPASRHSVTFLQVSPPSRDAAGLDEDIRARLDLLAGRVNDRFGPVVALDNVLYRRDELVTMLRSAAVGLVTPLRDGMNLVAKEYVAAQDPKDPGVLILSRRAGAAEQMTDALLVDPYDRAAVGEAIGTALAMPLAERIGRWERLFSGVVRDDVTAWRDSFLSELQVSGTWRPRGDSNTRPAV